MGQMILEVQKWLNKTYVGEAGFQSIPENGETGWTTTNALLVGLQIEVGIPYASIENEINSGIYNFSSETKTNCPEMSFSTELNTESLKNIAMILQGGFWCKGINPGNFGPEFTSEITSAIKTLQGWAGIQETGIATYLEFKALLSMDTFRVIDSGDSNVRIIQQSINGQYASDMQELIPCDGLVNRQLQGAFLFVLEMLDGFPAESCRYALEPSNFGYFASNLLTRTPEITLGDSNKFVSLLQYVLYCSGYTNIKFTNTYDEQTFTIVEEFKSLMMLGSGPEINGEIWESLLTSHGYSGRPSKACDTATTLSEEDAKNLKNAGYEIVGRYLTGRFATSVEELQNIFNGGLRAFPIFEYGNTPEYFTAQQGTEDAFAAFTAAKKLGIPSGTTIYFAIDCDILDGDVQSTVIPYFQGINRQFQLNESPYKIGVYGARNICSQTRIAGLVENIFVSSLSAGYSGNIMNYSMPTGWAFNQFATISVEGIGIDKDAYSGIDTGFGTISADVPVTQPTGEFIACDTSSIISPEQAATLAANGFKIVGRTLNSTNPLTLGEIGHITAVGLNVVPIYVSSASTDKSVYWNEQVGTTDAVNAAKLVNELGFNYNATIYFTANGFNTQEEINSCTLPYFEGVQAQFKLINAKKPDNNTSETNIYGSNNNNTQYEIGIYGPRNACLATQNAGYTKLSFVEDASNIRYGNSGFNMPSNWSFNQFGAGSLAGLGYNKDTSSGKDTGGLDLNSVNTKLTFNTLKGLLQELYLVANTYNISNEGKAILPSIIKNNIQILNYLRYYTYNDLDWSVVLGTPDSGFYEYVKRTNPNLEQALLPYIANDQILIGIGKTILGLGHLAATTQAYSSSTTPHFWSGWGGDIATLMTQVNYANSFETINIEDYANELMAAPNGSAFSLYNFYEDLDAIYLAKILSSKPFGDLLEDYYIGNQNNLKGIRTNSIVTSVGALSVQDLGEALYNQFIGNEGLEWLGGHSETGGKLKSIVTNHGKYPLNYAIIKACCYAFANKVLDLNSDGYLE